MNMGTFRDSIAAIRKVAVVLLFGLSSLSSKAAGGVELALVMAGSTGQAQYDRDKQVCLNALIADHGALTSTEQETISRIDEAYIYGVILQRDYTGTPSSREIRAKYLPSGHEQLSFDQKMSFLKSEGGNPAALRDYAMLARDDAQVNAAFRGYSQLQSYEACIAEAEAARIERGNLPATADRSGLSNIGASPASGNREQAAAHERARKQNEAICNASINEHVQTQLSEAGTNQTIIDLDRDTWVEPKTHLAELEASHCLSPIKGGNFGGFLNSCPFKVAYAYCDYQPKQGSWAESFDCEKNSFGTDTIGPGSESVAHTHNTGRIYWVACKYPEGMPVDMSFTPGQGAAFRCAAWEKPADLADGAPSSQEPPDDNISEGDADSPTQLDNTDKCLRSAASRPVQTGTAHPSRSSGQASGANQAAPNESGRDAYPGASKADVKKAKGAPLPQVRAVIVKNIGNGCFTAKVSDIRPWNEAFPDTDDSALITVELRNTCNKMQLVEALAQGDYYVNDTVPFGPPQRPHWRGAFCSMPWVDWRTSVPKDLGFSPPFMNIHAACNFTASGVATATFIRLRTNSSPILLQLASCDAYDQRGTEQTAFRDWPNYNLNAFICRPNYPPPLSEQFKQLLLQLFKVQPKR